MWARNKLVIANRLGLEPVSTLYEGNLFVRKLAIWCNLHILRIPTPYVQPYALKLLVDWWVVLNIAKRKFQTSGESTIDWTLPYVAMFSGHAQMKQQQWTTTAIFDDTYAIEILSQTFCNILQYDWFLIQCRLFISGLKITSASSSTNLKPLSHWHLQTGPEFLALGGGFVKVTQVLLSLQLALQSSVLAQNTRAVGWRGMLRDKWNL